MPERPSDQSGQRDLAVRRKRLRYQCWHRGTKELDLLVGGFADAHLAGFDAGQMARLESLLSVPEPLLYDWILGREAPDPEHDHDVMKLLQDFRIKPAAS